MLSRPVSSARQELLGGLTENRLALHYQPQFELSGQRVSGFEGVVRWNHPKLGLLMPGLFLGLAQREGLLARMTRVLLEQAGGAAASWRRAGSDVSVSINLGRDDLDDLSLPADAVLAVRDYGTRPERVTLEINEEHLVDFDRTRIERLEAFRQAGFGLALDGKGVPVIDLTAVPSGLFTQLKCGGLTLLKVAELLKTLNASTFLRRVDQARAMDMPVIAVGAEDEGALRSFVRAGFTHVQGDLLCPAIPFGDTQLFLDGPPALEGSVPVTAPAARIEQPAVPARAAVMEAVRPSAASRAPGHRLGLTLVD